MALLTILRPFRPSCGSRRAARGSLVIFFAALLFMALLSSVGHAQDVAADFAFFSSIKDRSTGSEGSEKAADYVYASLEKAGLSPVESHKLITPVPEVSSASVEINGEALNIYPWGPNMAYLPMTPEEGVRGTLVYAGGGSPAELDGKPIKDSIVLMEMESYSNWLNAAMFGAKALIFLGDRGAIKGSFSEKSTPTPLAFPRFWASPEAGERLRGLALAKGPELEATVKCRTRWRNKLVRNIYGLIPGKSPDLKNEVIVLDAFYDASSHVLGIAPGADESTSIVMLLSLARHLMEHRPDRSVLLVATTGNGQALAGMRELVWALSSRRKVLRKETKELKTQQKRVSRQLALLSHKDPLDVKSVEDGQLMWQLVVEKAKDKTDVLTREIQYRKALNEEESALEMDEPRLYRRLSWLSGMGEMSSEQRKLALGLLKEARDELSKRRRELKDRRDAMNSSLALRNLLEDYTPVLFISLYLSSHSPNVGVVEMGETYPIMENVKRIVRAGRLVDLLSKVSAELAKETGLPDIIINVARSMSSDVTAGQADKASHPCCDVGALAGLPSVALMTLDDNRSLWSTPHDTPDRVDTANMGLYNRVLPLLMSKLLSSPSLQLTSEGVRGLASLEGRTMFIRQGELFPDQPAPGTIVSVILGNNIFRAMSFMDGSFLIPGLANRRVVLQKLVLEPYGIDPETGRVAWTADKVQTGKDNYRIKVKSDLASTSLVMFHCLQTDVLGAFNPRNMANLTKVDLLDAKTEASPLRYWFSRVDGRDTNAISVFLEKGSRFKLILSETLLGKDFFLLNSSPENPSGKGFLIGSPATIGLAPRQVVNDLHALLGVRLANLFQHGIVNRNLGGLYETAGRELDAARKSLESHQYDAFWREIVSAWARLNSIYAEIESTQRDVLTGVMFFIALFVPFAFCMERYLFSFRGIYQQIASFLMILIITVLIIRALHPAFQITYSPMVVIIAFFIVGLSVLVSWIIFVRFEKEMEDLHNRSVHLKAPQVSKWQAFGAGFAIGVSNLNRRKLRTGLTCVTLIILTFTVMSFTNVKSLNKTTSTRLADTAPYEGILLRHQYWLPLPAPTLQEMQAVFPGEGSIWTRGWIDPSGGGSSRTVTKVKVGRREVAAEGVLGVGADPPQYFRNMILHGRWLQENEKDVILMPVAMAHRLGLRPETDLNIRVELQGDPFTVAGYFDGAMLASMKDLDQNPITPAYLEMSLNEEASEVEIEAMQSGDIILPSTERFRYADADSTIIMSFARCVEYGGLLKAITIRPGDGRTPLEAADGLASWLQFPLFVGQDGTWYHSASTTLRYQGVANLFVPILIVIFITLNTMIGHVHERQKEISTYTSVGLAPTHVGFLFIVEALSMAVISTVIGYILAQLSARYMGNSPLFSQLTFNYSSLASVACMFLVFSVVFLAALYPARMAAEIAMPDVDRSWTLPDPDGDLLVMNLPFLLKYEEEKGVMGFLNRFYTSHQDVAHGSFIVDETYLDVDAPSHGPGQSPAPVCLLIRTNVWLAPFDFGIKQRIQLYCCPSYDNPGYLEIALRMIRLSGEHSAWFRANKNFIKALRKEMLLWRLLDQEAKTHFQGLAPVSYAGQLEESPS